jgi:hypothetical protein
MDFTSALGAVACYNLTAVNLPRVSSRPEANPNASRRTTRAVGPRGL